MPTRGKVGRVWVEISLVWGKENGGGYTGDLTLPELGVMKMTTEKVSAVRGGSVGGGFTGKGDGVR